MKWIKEAISDESHMVDMAYVVIGLLALAAIFALAFIFIMSAISFATCQPVTSVTKSDAGTVTIVPCTFDPLPIGQAAGLIFGAFSALIASLAGYMAATRRRPHAGE